MTKRNKIDIPLFERSLTDWIASKMRIVVEAFEERYQKANLAAMDTIIPPMIGLAVRSLNVSSGWDATSVTANSGRREQLGITASFEKLSDRNITVHEFNVNDETYVYVSDEVSEFPVPRIRFDGRPTVVTELN